MTPLFAQEEVPTAQRPGMRTFDRPHALTAELGWNGLVGGFGFMYSYYAPEQASVADAGFGFGVTGPRFGARYRHLLAPKKRTSPFVGVGLNYATGMGETEMDVTDSNEDTLKVFVNPSANLLFQLGLDVKANNGFVFIPSIGYGFDMMENDYDISSGVENRVHRQALRILLKSGFLLTFIVGFSF
jgi:OmpW family